MYFGATIRSADFTSGVSAINNVIGDNNFLGYSFMIVGGGWDSRNPDSGAGGVFGGIQMGHPALNTPWYWGINNGLLFTNNNVQGAPMPKSLLTAVDQFWETNVWKTQNGPASPNSGITGLLSTGEAPVPSRSRW